MRKNYFCSGEQKTRQRKERRMKKKTIQYQDMGVFTFDFLPHTKGHLTHYFLCYFFFFSVLISCTCELVFRDFVCGVCMCTSLYVYNSVYRLFQWKRVRILSLPVRKNTIMAYTRNNFIVYDLYVGIMNVAVGIQGVRK